MVILVGQAFFVATYRSGLIFSMTTLVGQAVTVLTYRSGFPVATSWSGIHYVDLSFFLSFFLSSFLPFFLFFLFLCCCCCLVSFLLRNVSLFTASFVVFNLVPAPIFLSAFSVLSWRDISSVIAFQLHWQQMKVGYSIRLRCRR